MVGLDYKDFSSMPYGVTYSNEVYNALPSNLVVSTSSRAYNLVKLSSGVKVSSCTLVYYILSFSSSVKL